MTGETAHEHKGSCCGGHAPMQAQGATKIAAFKDGKARDPICGMSVDVANAKHTARWRISISISAAQAAAHDSSPRLSIISRSARRTRSAAWRWTPRRTPHDTRSAAELFLLLRRMPGEVRGRPRPLLGATARRRAAARAEGAIYTCPMHPEIRQVGPGTCPICGMALEPRDAERRGGAEPRIGRHDAAVLDRRWLLAVPVVVLEMGGHCRR